jgi:pantetheine-phosphate adenylyltransferase
MSKQFKKIAVGGTYDHFHQGHRHLLHTALDQADSLLVGVTSDEMVKHKVFTQSIQSHQERVQTLNDYLSNLDHHPQFEIVSLEDPYGPTLTDDQINAIAVTDLTLPGANAINFKRQEQQMPPLAVIRADLVKDQSGQYLSSTRIRAGKVNRQGQVYTHFLQNNNLFSEAAKAAVKSPQGRLLLTEAIKTLPFDQYVQIALLGDQVTEYFINHDLPFNYAIIDHKINRRAHSTNLGHWQPQHRLIADNPPGTVSLSATSAISHLTTQNQGLLEIAGEEDLLGFPLVLCLPLNSVIFYGQPGEGVVMITVTETDKERLVKILSHQSAD